MTDDDPTDTPTTIRPCPAWDRLDALMSEGGKVTKDGWTPASFAAWWTYGTDRETA